MHVDAVAHNSSRTNTSSYLLLMDYNLILRGLRGLRGATPGPIFWGRTSRANFLGTSGNGMLLQMADLGKAHVSQEYSRTTS